MGPVVARPFRSADDLARLRPLDPEADTALRARGRPHRRRRARPPRVPLIGFAGAPFTVASYLVEGGPSRDFTRTKALMHGDPGLWARLLDALADLALASLRSQVGGGAAAVQLFDSWVGRAVARGLRDAASCPPRRRVLAWPGRPGGAAHPLRGGHRRAARPDGHGRCRRRRGRLAGAARRGPAADRARATPCRATSIRPPVWRLGVGRATRPVRSSTRGGGTGHIFNLGHGVLPETDPAILERLVSYVHEQTPDVPGAVAETG